jgi:hypothetical protein
VSIPAETAYLEPDHGDARVSRRGGIVNWTSDATSIQWFGKAKEAGLVGVKLRIKSNENGEATLHFQIGEKTTEKTVKLEQVKETVVRLVSFQSLLPAITPSH